MSKIKWPAATAISGALLLVGTVVGAANKVAFDFEPTITKALSGDGISSSFSKEDLAAGAELTTNICENGLVLLKNTDMTLPTEDWTLNIFGFGGSDNGWFYQGNGSGAGSKTGRVPLYKAFRDWGWTINETLASAYNSCGLTNRVPVTEDPSQNYQIRETSVDFVTSRLDSAKAFSDQAMIVISRYGGEGNDLPKFQYKDIGGTVSYDMTRHYNELTSEEEQIVAEICNKFSTVYVLFNCCNVMEMGFVDEYDSIKAAMYMPMGGNAGAYAVPKIMSGLSCPSGKLSDTVAYDFTKDPTYANMSYTTADGSVPTSTNWDFRVSSRRFSDHLGEYIQYTAYEESIYIGYYWYETADAEGYFDSIGGYDKAVQYPFGYGLSYTSFAWESEGPTILNKSSTTTLEKDDTLEIRVDVSNIGGFSSKDVVELYVEKPYTKGGIEKPAVQLAGFAKTADIKSGSSQEETVIIRVRLQDIADYDCYDKNNDGHMGYELDAGTYKFSLRTDAHTVKLDKDGNPMTYSFTLDQTAHYDEDADTGYEIKNRFTTYTNSTSGANSVNNDKHPTNGVCGSIDGSDFNGTGIGATYLSRSDFAGTFPDVFLPAVALGDWYEKTYKVLSPWDDYTGPVPLQNQAGTVMITDLFGKDYDDPLWDELMDRLSYEELNELVVSPGSFGTSKIDKIGKPRTVDKDGPCGFNSGVSGASMSATNYPSDTMIACTWDYKMSYQFGKSLGDEAINKLGGIDGNYGPGLNIHRSPFGGRNFEYYSEDPVLSGVLCSWQISGAKEEGMYCYVKHIALNDSDTGRNGRYNFCTEQAFRQIYAKPFEIISKGACIYDLDGNETRAFTANAAMGSVDRLGTTRVTGSYNFLTEMLRNEWGFRGTVITDYYQSGNVNDVDEGIRAGNDLMLNGANNCTLDDSSSNTYKYYIRQAAKNILYTYVDTKNCQATASGLDIGSIVVEKSTVEVWWTKTLVLVDVVIFLNIGVGLYFAWSPVLIAKFKKRGEK